VTAWAESARPPKPDVFERIGRTVLRLFTSVDFAVVQIIVLILLAVVGMTIRQLPSFAFRSVGDYQNAMADIHARYDPVFGRGVVDALERLQVFQVFTSTWFTLGLVVLVVSIVVCTLDRTPRLYRQAAEIRAKLNSLVDEDLIRALYDASSAGVRIRLNVRGICCLRPGLRGVSEKIEVVSIVDRFLEHSRIFHFRNGGDEEVYLSSADLMPRNLDRRIELLFPVEAPDCARKVLACLDAMFADNVKARVLQQDGSYKRKRPARGEDAVRAQIFLYREAERELGRSRAVKGVSFEPIERREV